MNIEIDARGLTCPYPVIKAKKAADTIIEQHKSGTVEIVVDNEIAMENIVKLARHKEFNEEHAVIGKDEYRVRIYVGGNYEEIEKKLVVVRGGGDLATGTIYKLIKAGFYVLVTEIEKPSAIRRQVSFCEAVYCGKMIVEDMECCLVADIDEAIEIMSQGKPAIMIDPDCNVIKFIRPIALVDAIIAKKNLGTNKNMAPRTIALGPGFTAGADVDYVIETQRGHNLGRVLTENSAAPNSGVPGLIGGFGKERVIHASDAGIIQIVANIGDIVNKGEVIAYIVTDERKIPVEASIDGILRGLIRDDFKVTKGFKIADIDPRVEELTNCFTISDKARCIAGGVLEAIMR